MVLTLIKPKTYVGAAASALLLLKIKIKLFLRFNFFSLPLSMEKDIYIYIYMHTNRIPFMHSLKSTSLVICHLVDGVKFFTITVSFLIWFVFQSKILYRFAFIDLFSCWTHTSPLRGDHGLVRVEFVPNPRSTRPSWVPNFQTCRWPIRKSDQIGQFLPESGRVLVGVEYLENGENPAKKIWKTAKSGKKILKNGRNLARSHQIQRDLGHFRQDLG